MQKEKVNTQSLGSESLWDGWGDGVESSKVLDYPAGFVNMHASFKNVLKCYDAPKKTFGAS